MIYALPYQTEELLKHSYFKLRNIIDTQSDTIQLLVSHSHLQDLSNEEIYKKMLQLEGKYRSETGKWIAKPVKVRILNQL